MLRGNGKTDLFFDDNDFGTFLHYLKKYKGDTCTELFAYCLMNNHVHLLLRAENDKLSLFLKKVGVSYSSHFNRKYEHFGHVFQDRFKSECIDDEHYFICALRYIIRNPDEAGMRKWIDYKWSSASDYINESSIGITDTQFAFDMLGKKQGVIALFDAPLTRKLAEPVIRRRSITDADALKIISTSAESLNYDFRNNIPIELRSEFIKRVLHSGVTVRQFERIADISRGVIQKNNK